MEEYAAEERGSWIVETTYNTDPEGKWVPEDDWSNRTFHGPFATEAEAIAFMEGFLPDDTDVKEMLTCYVNTPESVRS